ncbi:MAG: dihydroorotase [Dehalococcoidia bacterium]|nr:dihydroorotase [Dehalococcoidia bacterium]
MNECVILHDVRVIDPGSGTDSVRDLCILDGVLLNVLPDGRDGCVHVDGRGLVASPSFIDLHCHLRQPGSEDKETVRTGTMAAAAGGFGTVCCMPNTRPPMDTAANVRALLDIVRTDAVVEVLPFGTVTVGRLGREVADLEGLAVAGVVGFSDDGDYVLDSVVMRDALERAAELQLPVIDHAQDGGLVMGGVMNEGEVSTLLGVPGMPPAAEELAVCRDIALARTTGAHVHIAHITTGRAVEMVRRAQDEGLKVTAEATPHHMVLTDECAIIVEGQNGERGFNNQAKVNPPLRNSADAMAVARGLADGVISAIATDHAPHTVGNKQGSPESAAFGISGFETALGLVLKRYHEGVVSLPRLVHALTCGGAGILRLPDSRVSFPDDSLVNLTLFDPDYEWTVDSAHFLSKGKNTPVDGWTLRGKVLATFIAGKCVHVDEALRSRCTGGDITSQ